MKKSVQELFDAFVADHGSEATISAINGHVHPDSDATCPTVACSKGYICINHQCKLDLGGGI